MIKNYKFYILLAVIGCVLRIIPIWQMPVWYDEAFTIQVARLPLGSLLSATAGDVHPPLYYLICWPLAHIPNIPDWMVGRLPSLVASILSIYIWLRILQTMDLNPRSKLLAFGLFCFIPELIYYAQEGRMYSVLVLLVLSAWLCIWERRWFWLAVCISAMVWIHNYGLIYAATLWVAYIIYDRSFWKQITLAIGSGVLSFIPWALVLFRQMGSIDGSYWIMRFSVPSVLGDLLHSFFGNMDLKQDLINFIVFYTFLFWVLIWTVRNKKVNISILVLSFMPVMLAAFISLVWQPIMLWRALIPSGPFIGLLLITPLEHLSRKAAILIAVFFVSALATNLINIMFRYQWASANIRDLQMINIINEHWRDGDLLYYTDDGTFVIGSLSWTNIDNAILAKPCGVVYGSLSPLTRSALGMRVDLLPDDYPGRVWIVADETPLTPSCQLHDIRSKGWLNSEPVFCSNDTELVRSCLYLSTP